MPFSMFRQRVTRSRVENVVIQLGYNFAAFELVDFVKHVGQIRQKRILVFPYDFDVDLFGLWIPAPSTDYIFFNTHVHPTHQVHIVLHEIAHMLLGHRLYPIDQILPAAVMVEFREAVPLGRLRAATHRQLPKDEEEQESEEFVFCIQKAVGNHQRLAELTGESSSIHIFKRFSDGMGFES